MIASSRAATAAECTVAIIVGLNVAIATCCENGIGACTLDALVAPLLPKIVVAARRRLKKMRKATAPSASGTITAAEIPPANGPDIPFVGMTR